MFYVKTNRERYEEDKKVGIQKKRKGQMKNYEKTMNIWREPKTQDLISNL